MSLSIYKMMIEDSPVAYIHVKLSEDEIGNCVALEVLNYNKSYERIMLKENELTIDDIKQVVSDLEITNKISDFCNKLKKSKKCTVESYINHAKNYFNIDAYYGENNEFHFRLTKISDKHKKLSSALKNAPFASWIKDRDGKYIDANEGYLEFLQISYEEIIGKTNYDFTTKENAERIHNIEEEIMQKNKFVRYQDEAIKADRYFEVLKWPYMDKYGGMPLGTFGMAIEITDKIRLTKKLEESENQFLEIANNIKDIIVIRDKKKALYISPAFEEIYKFKPDKLYEDIDKWYDNWDEIEFDVGEPKPYEYKKSDVCTIRVKKKGESDIWLLTKFVPVFDEEGNLTKKIGVINDITELKKMQLEIDDMKMEFFANLSHELRTPINLILSALQLLYIKLDRLDDETQEYFLKYIKIVSQNGKRLLRLVNNLIDTTRLDSGCFDYSPKNSNIVSCIEDICISTSTFVNSKNLDIIFDTDREEKIVAFDQDNMERIILNLVSNAIKFNKPNGKIEVKISCNENVIISVKDTGIGIPPDKLDSIFGRFEQVKSKFKKEKEGSGIGLSLVKSLVEIHGGNIVVKSKLGEGSEFIITLPDILVENEIKSQPQYMSDENRMTVEFSDIYI